MSSSIEPIACIAQGRVKREWVVFDTGVANRNILRKHDTGVGSGRGRRAYEDLHRATVDSYRLHREVINADMFPLMHRLAVLLGPMDDTHPRSPETRGARSNMHTMREDPYKTFTERELAQQPCAYRDGLFNGQVVLITGAAGGIGTACSVLLGRLGATIVGCGRSLEGLTPLENNLGELGIDCWTHAMSIRDPDAVSALISQVWERHGRLDVVVNNAGGQFAAPSVDITPKGWNAVVETNLTGT
ncbi:MAG: hypothetical protein ACI8PT_001565 [Gammaproteobacteria bacterium]|jgi:hypothetical protein